MSQEVTENKTETKTEEVKKEDQKPLQVTSEEKKESVGLVLDGDDPNVKKSMKLFKIAKKLGGGAEGAVYLATHLKSQRQVAIKSQNIRNEEDAKKMRKEVRRKSLIILA